MSSYLCHDFKTPRTDTSKRLPESFKAVPVLFYLALLVGTYFMTMDWMAYKRAQTVKAQADTTREEHEKASSKMRAQKEILDAETKKAEAVAKWMEGARNLQPISVAIARAVPPEVTLSNLTLERSDQVPSNLALSVNINGGTAAEVAMIEASLARLQYRSYSPQQSKNGSVIEYRSTLVRQE
ncbi:MAG TPA: hypothetical protein VD994_18775 [Prosthecobacter sp.]|nr:hypothetical protein [Prosthecobacter sp.]